MTACARGCMRWRRHLEDCPVPNGSEGTWVPVLIEDEETRAELRAYTEEELRQATGFTLGQYGQIQRWHDCTGCVHRPADYGVLCDQCYTKLRSWLGGQRNLAWCWSWLAADLEPGQSAQGDKIKGTRTPPAAMAVHIHDLRQDILSGLGAWLGSVCARFDLDGPKWFRHRQDEARRRQLARSRDASAPLAEMDWRAWLPQTGEVTEACRFLAAWLDRMAESDDVLPVFEAAGKLYRRVQTVAPWEPKARRMDGLVCPVCDREALVRWEGDEHLTCRRCSGVVTRQRYDIWSRGLESEKAAS